MFAERGRAAGAAPRFPLGTLLKEYPGRLLLGIGAAIGLAIVWTYDTYA